MGDTPVEALPGLRALHPEGTLWDAGTARLWWVDISGERVHCFDPESSNDSSWRTPGQPGGVVLDAAREPVLAAPDGLTISNGPAFDGPGGRLYLADTGICVIDVFDLDPEKGSLSGRRRLADFTDAQTWPDGMTVDDAGMPWVAMGRAGAVHRYRPDGTLDGVVELPTSNPTSVAFGGVDAGDLYITTSWFDCEPDNRAQPLAGAIFRCRPGVTGRPSPRYVEASARLGALSKES
jgi:sugar lactone lactonase YvrE